MSQFLHEKLSYHFLQIFIEFSKINVVLIDIKLYQEAILRKTKTKISVMILQSFQNTKSFLVEKMVAPLLDLGTVGKSNSESTKSITYTL